MTALLPGLISVDEALDKVLALATLAGTETVAVTDGAGRWLADDAVAQRDQPPFAASAMDGYALRGPANVGDTFTVVGEAGAGHAFGGIIGPGAALRIFTGAPVPDGATHVVIQENARRTGNILTITEADNKSNIRPQGDDFAIGFRLTPRRLTPRDLALLAAMNISRLTVRRRPVVAIIATGDELVMPGEQPRPDQIIASNSIALKALVESAGGIARLLPIARDTEDSLRAVFDLTEGADLIVTSGGASVGDHDVVARLAESLGMERSFYKIAMRPGKPLMAGRMRGVPMLGLPGNPVSALVCAQLFLLPLLRAIQGDSAPAPVPLRAVLGECVGPAGPRAHYMRANLREGRGLPEITADPRQDSALLSVLSAADALLIRPPGDGPRRAGEEVSYLAL